MGQDNHRLKKKKIFSTEKYLERFKLTFARFWIISQDARWSKVSINALVTVDAGGEVLTLLTDAATLHVTVYVHAHPHHVHSLVVVTLAAVTVTVARLALEPIVRRVSSPLLLREPVLALLAVDPLGVVLTLALQHLGVDRRGADVGVAVTHAPVDIIDIE